MREEKIEAEQLVLGTQVLSLGLLNPESRSHVRTAYI